MSDTVESFLSSRLPIAGLVAYSYQLRDGAVSSDCLSKSFYPVATEQMLHAAVQTSRTLLSSGEREARYCWTFECLRVYIAARADGACLALLVENNPSVQMVRIQDTLQAFAELEGL
jgi:hypothetical protein